MLRISTTTIDLFNKFMSEPDQSDLGSEMSAEDKFLQAIKGETPPSKYMELGTAFHSILEDPHKYFNDATTSFVYNGIEFPFDVITKCYDEIHYGFPFEVKEEKIYTVNGEDIIVVAKVDQLEALIVNEFKSTWSTFSIDRYNKSVQWKFYINIFQALFVEYIVFCLNDSAAGITLKSIERFTCYPYPELQDDINSILAQFVDYIHFRGLEQYFQLRDSKPALDMNKKAFENMDVTINRPELNGYAAMFGKPFNNGVLK